MNNFSRKRVNGFKMYIADSFRFLVSVQVQEGVIGVGGWKKADLVGHPVEGL